MFALLDLPKFIAQALKVYFLLIVLLINFFATAKLDSDNKLDSDLDGYPNIVEITSTAERKAFPRLVCCNC